MGKRHITVLRFIDITIVTEGLHRGGQDDVDAHARRFDNRIIRNSTRLATFAEDEMSDFYKGKILTTGSMLAKMNRNIPEKVYEMNDGHWYTEEEYNTIINIENVYAKNVWVRAANGYILEEYKDDKDVMRGLYPLSIPSNFISKINLCEWGHVFGERNQDGSANPEVKEWAEAVLAAITQVYPQITREYVLSIEN
jgi:thymidylate synthase ThyX